MRKVKRGPESGKELNLSNISDEDRKRFAAKVECGQGENDCDIWIGGCSKGYGRFGWKGRDIRAHRFSYAMAIGPISARVLVRHKCDNPRCVRPDHLILGTQKDNIADCVERKRLVRAKGEENGQSVLTEEKVFEAVELYKSGSTLKEVADSFGVGLQTIHYALSGKSWSHLNFGDFDYHALALQRKRENAIRNGKARTKSATAPPIFLCEQPSFLSISTPI